MGYLPAIIVCVVGLLVVLVLVVVVVGHLRRTTRAADVLRASVATSTDSLRSGAAFLHDRRAGRS